MMKKDEIAHLKRDNKQFLDEEQERLQTESVQETAEVRGTLVTACFLFSHEFRWTINVSLLNKQFSWLFSLQIKLSATQGNTLTLEQIVKLQEQHVQQNVQLSHLALHVQCLQAENEKLLESMEALNSAHRVRHKAQFFSDVTPFFSMHWVDSTTFFHQVNDFTIGVMIPHS